MRGIHRRPVNSPHKWPVTRKMFPFDDVIMVSLCVCTIYVGGLIKICFTLVIANHLALGIPLQLCWHLAAGIQVVLYLDLYCDIHSSYISEELEGDAVDFQEQYCGYTMVLFLCVRFEIPLHDDIIKWKHFPRYWCVCGEFTGHWINGWVNNREADNLRRHCAHYDVIVMIYRKKWS